MNTDKFFGESLLTGLIFACPLGKSQLNCPFAKLRTLSIENRLQVVDEYSVEHKEKILSQHRKCLCKHDIFTARKHSIIYHSLDLPLPYGV